jgi:hypothetical protein
MPSTSTDDTIDSVVSRLSLTTDLANRQSWGKQKSKVCRCATFGSNSNPRGLSAAWLAEVALAISHHCFRKPASGLTDQTCGGPQGVNTI